jgi:hypothetical protein
LRPCTWRGCPSCAAPCRKLIRCTWMPPVSTARVACSCAWTAGGAGS